MVELWQREKVADTKLEPGEELIEIIWRAGIYPKDVVIHLAENRLIVGKKFSDYRKLDVHYRYQGKPGEARIENIAEWKQGLGDIVGIEYVSDTSFRRIKSEVGIHAIIGRK